MSERSDSGKCLNPTTTTLENSLLGMSNFRPDSHVAQQSRRDKLRVQQNSNPALHIQDFPNHLIQLSREPGVNPDLIQVRNVRNCDLLYDPSIYSSEMLNFSTNAHVFLAQRDPMLHQETGPSSNPSYWKGGLGSHQSCDWIVNHVNGSQTNACNESPSFVGGSLSGTATVKGNSVSSSNLYSKPGYNGLQPSLTHPSSEISCQDSQKQYGVMHDSSFYQNTLQEVVTSSTIGSQGFEMASAVQQNVRETCSWVDGGNELAVLPAYGNQNSSLKVGIVDGSHMWSSELGFVGNKSGGEIGTFVGDSTAQGLSLSLSSHGPQFGERFGSEELQSRTNVFNGSRDSKTTSSGYLCSSSKSPHGAKGYGSSIQGIVSSSTYACPLGPFTGYATILKSSKFLKPAQQLLDEFCSVTGPNLITCEVTEKGSRDMISSCDTVNTEHEIGARGRSSGVSSCSFYSSVEASGEGGVGNGSYQSYHPEFQQRKAKLLFMQEEVCRRYKQYHQQMQMVVSSFESVAGLSAATPYTSLALKTVSRHFRCLKNAISDQLRHICRALGEDLSSPTTGTSSSKGDTMMPRLRLIDQGLQKHKSGADSLGFQEAQHHVWRPQRGLPERSVAVLRAWLFEHFLHPYPTDTDKHMLATQTGLSRNQVSNWFINARVRLWKPMIEEIHMLETKGSAETNLSPGKNNGKPATNSDNEPVGDHPSNQSVIDAMSEKRSECSGVGSMSNAEDDRSSELYNQEKRSRMEHQFPAGVDGGLMGFMPCHQGSLEMGGLGAVSLTLGLRQNTESSQQQQQQQGHQLIRHFGGQMIHDFVG